VRLESGELAYITKRFDRKVTRAGITKLAQEDLCQLSGLLTENKYNSSMEKVGKVIRQFSMNPGLDAITFLEIAIFSFVTGNADMHTKNFSLLTAENGIRGLSPAYDLLATKFLVPQDDEETALPINGKKTRLKREDFVALGMNLQIQEKVIGATLLKFSSPLKSTFPLIDKSFVSSKLKEEFKSLLTERMARIEK
jgi:serine/threonine-protein kinase HipA